MPWHPLTLLQSVEDNDSLLTFIMLHPCRLLQSLDADSLDHCALVLTQQDATVRDGPAGSQAQLLDLIDLVIVCTIVCAVPDSVRFACPLKLGKHCVTLRADLTLEILVAVTPKPVVCHAQGKRNRSTGLQTCQAQA